jgi:hypothetical protein
VRSDTRVRQAARKDLGLFKRHDIIKRAASVNEAIFGPKSAPIKTATQAFVLWEQVAGTAADWGAPNLARIYQQDLQ